VPDTDSVQLNPVAVGTEVINGRTYYRFALQKEYAFPTVGDYTVPLEYVHPVIENCSNSVVSNLTVHVVGAPVVDINAVTTGCIGDSVQFAATVTAQNNDVVHTLHWNFGDNTTSNVPMPLKLYQAAGTYNVKVDVVTQIGCIASVTEPLVLKGPAAFDFVSDTVNGCPNAAVTLAIKDPETGVVYNWYDNETGGAVVHTGAKLTINPFTATKKYYVAATKDGCTTKPRQVVTAWLLPSITTPIVRVDSTGTNQVRFAWTAVPGAAGYQVSTDGGTTWSTPSSGANGLTHTVTGLNGGQQVTLLVKALDPNHCQDRISAPATTNTLPDQIFIPNAFSPNNDGLNDEFKVEGFIIRSMQLRVFNQWGEIVFETTDQNRGWDGKHKGKLQPSGVYMYVCSMVLQDGSKVVRKGAVNLVR
jgi:trimeric autotransporter adhesin